MIWNEYVVVLQQKTRKKAKAKKECWKKKGEHEKNKVERQRIKVGMENTEGLKRKKNVAKKFFNEQWSIKNNWNNGWWFTQWSKI